ncbi:MAG TPA: hypothetical protein VIK41_07850, partial [Gemmatimonadaceae bacterium]
ASGSSRMPYPSSIVGWTWITICLDLPVSMREQAPNVRRHGRRRSESCRFYEGHPTIASTRTATRE